MPAGAQAQHHCWECKEEEGQYAFFETPEATFIRNKTVFTFTGYIEDAK